MINGHVCHICNLEIKTHAYIWAECCLKRETEHMCLIKELLWHKYFKKLIFPVGNLNVGFLSQSTNGDPNL